MHPSIVAILSSGLTQTPPIYYTPLTSSNRSSSRPSPSIPSLAHRLIDRRHRARSRSSSDINSDRTSKRHHRRDSDRDRTPTAALSPSPPRSPIPPSTEQQMFSVSHGNVSSHVKDGDVTKGMHRGGEDGGNISNEDYFMVSGAGKDQQTQTPSEQKNRTTPTSSHDSSDHYQTKQVWMISSCANPYYGTTTLERPVADYCEKTIPSAGVGRALAAPSIDAPHGSTERFPIQPKPMKKARYALWPSVSDYARDPPAGYDRTVLQQHVDYWDVDNDGIITISETFVGLRALGFSLFNCILGTFVIHSMMSYPTGESWIPDYRFRIYIKNIHRGKHGSDAEVYDTEGRFIPQKFEDLFSRFDRLRRNYLTIGDIKNLWIVDRNPFDVIGVIATVFEFGFLWLLAADDEGRLWKEDMRANYDGTLFYRIAKSRYTKRGMLMENENHGDNHHSYGSILLLIGAAVYAMIVTTLSILYMTLVR